MSARYLLLCNGCGAASPVRSEISIKNARAFNKARGWTYVKPGQDFCKSCSESRAKAEKGKDSHGDP